jgi:hypothetical protein
MIMRRLDVSRHKSKIQMFVVVMVLLTAVAAPVQARTTAGRAQPRVTKYEKKPSLPSWFRWMVKRLSRYAMAAN